MRGSDYAKAPPIAYNWPIGEFTTHDPLGLTGLTYDDVLLPPELTDVVPSSVNTSSRLAKSISLCILPLSAVMDAVTEAHMAIAMIRQGDIGILRRNLPIEEQTAQARQVKRSKSGMVKDPVTVGPGTVIDELDSLYGHYHVSGLPVVSENGTLLGVITNRGLRFVPQDKQATLHVRDCMTPCDQLVVGQVGISREHAKHLLAEHRVEKLPIVGDNDYLTGLITVKDFAKTEQYPSATEGPRGRLVVGAAVGYWGDTWERATALAEADVDVLVVGTANGSVQLALNMIHRIKTDPTFEGIDIIGGNIATTEGAQALIDAGVGAVKVGVSPGSVYTTRVVAGVDTPQITTVHLATEACGPAGVPLIAGGGLWYPGDIGKVFAADADTVMLGLLLASCEESPSEVVFTNGKQFEHYRGMGPLGTMNSRGHKSYSKDRYFQADITSDDRVVPEGIKGRVLYIGSLAQVVYQLVGSLHQTMFYLGASTISQVRASGRFVRTTSASLRELHPHDVQVTTKAPSYHPSSAKWSQAERS